MKFVITIDSAALSDLQTLRAFDRSAILDVIERVLSTTPRQVSRSRIKRLRGIDSPQYRLRVGEFRVFYDVSDASVYVMRVLDKAAVAKYLGEVTHEAQKRQRRTTGPGDQQGG